MKETAIEKIKTQSSGNKTLEIVAEHLIKHLDHEPNFADKILNDKKSMQEMLKYFFSEAKKLSVGNAACIDNETVLGWAVHYFDEVNIMINNKAAGTVIASNQPKSKKDTTTTKPKKVAKKDLKMDEVMLNIFDFIDGKENE